MLCLRNIKNMIKLNYFNDAPIITPDDDKFGIDSFAQALSHSIREIESPIGATIALNGPWGSGKSSAVNLIRHHLESDLENGSLQIIDFKCWWFRGEEALTLAFLQELNATLTKNLSDKAKELIPKLSKTLLQAGPVVGPAINLATGGIFGALTSGSMDFTKRFFPEGDNIEKLFQQLSKALDQQEKRFLVLIDDIDRLTPNEALLVFRLVKSVGRLPNVMYLLVFDRELAEKAVAEKYPSEGPHFLEKIIQASFELPLPSRDDLNFAALTQIESLCGPPKDNDQLRRFMNLFYDIISPYLITPRDLTRLANSLAISWPPVANEVDPADFVSLEILRLFEPLLFKAIRTNKERLCGTRSSYGKREDPEKEIQVFLDVLPEKNRQQARISLMRLFPRLENVGYSSSYIEQWEAQRRVCTTKHFDTYFRMTIGDETISINEIDELISKAGDKEFVKDKFYSAVKSIRKNGRSQVPLILDELNVHASIIDKDNFQSLITAIFEIADDIYRDEDSERGGFSIGNNYLRIHWLIRKLTFDRCNLDERSTIFMAACKNAQIGWLIDFASSSIDDHYPREGKEPEPPEKCLINKECVPELRQHSIEIIEHSAADGKLINHPQLPYILFRWQEFLGDKKDRVKEWTNEQLNSDVSVSILARAFTSESWSQGIGMFGLGDRVAIRNVKASVGSLDSIVDITEFRNRLEAIESNAEFDENLKEFVTVFLDAWRKQESGKE
ncbi:NTPase KAP [Candidatus Peregrinibacteria bacterium]|nr:NTPase KAP [Candidatus Peregrinibacteria bacterium]